MTVTYEVRRNDETRRSYIAIERTLQDGLMLVTWVCERKTTRQALAACKAHEATHISK